FVGTHDFTSFANAASKGAAGKNAVRTIYRIDVIKTDHGVRLEFEGNGFLYRMVRNMVGMMLDVASKKRPVTEINELFQAKDRRRSPKAAPARGLFLVQVIYC
ncbi:MAG: truA, partial [Chlamydiia bacterium]|nr:truA [Chlamydiia bacterium]